MPTPLTPRYYPSLGSLMNLDQIGTFQLPPAVQEFLESKFDQIFLKDFQFSTSFLGDNGFYSCSVISKDRLSFEIPGTSEGDQSGILFILNPDHPSDDPTARSVFPITIGYNWKILAYLRSVDLSIEDINGQSIGELAETLFDLGLRVLRLSDRQVLAHAISAFSNTNFSNSDSIEQFILDYNEKILVINALHPDNLLTPIGPIVGADRIGQLLEAIETSISGNENYSFVRILIELYILEFEGLDINIAQTKIRLNRFFRGLIPAYDVEAYLKDLLLPKFSASLKISAAIEFPRHMLAPVTQIIVNESVSFSETSETEKFTLHFEETSFEYHSERGFISDVDIELTSALPDEDEGVEINYAKVPNLPVYLGISSIKIDISDEKNIIEATADGRPISFKGIYLDTAEVYLPRGFKTSIDNSSLVSLKAERVLIGHNGSERPDDMVEFGVSGRYFLNREDGVFDPFIAQLGSLTIRFDEFDLTLQQNEVQNFEVVGSILFPDSDMPLAFTGEYSVVGDEVYYVITANYEGQFQIGNVRATMSQEQPLKLIFNENGVTSVEGDLELEFPAGDNPDEFITINVYLLYSSALESIQLSVYDFSQEISFEIGPLGIDPEMASLALGSGGIESLNLNCYLSIEGIMDENTPPQPKRFPASISYSELGGFDLSLSSGTSGGLTARLFGFEIELLSLTLSYMSGEPAIGQGTGKLRIPDNDNSLTELDFTLIKEANQWLLEIGNTPEFDIGNATLILEGTPTTSAFKIVFNEAGIANAEVRALLTLGSLSTAGSASNQPIILVGGYDQATSSIIFSADFESQNSGLEYNLGPVNIAPKSASVKFGNGKFEGTLGADITLTGLEEEQNPGVDKVFFASLEIRNEYNRILLQSADPIVPPALTPSLPGQGITPNAPAPQGTKGLAAGVGFEINLFDIRFNDTGILSDSTIAGTLTIAREENDPDPITLDYELEIIEYSGDSAFKATAFSDDVIDFNGLAIEFKQQSILDPSVDEASELTFTFSRDGIVDAGANLKVILNPSAAGASASDSTVLYIVGVYDAATSSFNFNTTISSAEISIGSVTVEPEGFGLSISQGRLTGASLTATLRIDDCRNVNGNGDKSFNISIGIFSEYIALNVANSSPPAERQAKLRGFSLQLEALSIRLLTNFSGFFNGEGWENQASAILTIPRANDQLAVDVTFSFSNDGYELALATDNPIIILNSNAAYIDLDLLKVSKDSDGIDFEIGGLIEIDSQIPAIESAIPRLIDVDSFGINQQGDSRSFTFEGQMTWEGGYNIPLGSADSGVSFYIPLDGLSSTLGEKVILDKLHITITPVSSHFEVDNTIEVKARFNWLGLELGPVYAVASGAGLKAIITDIPNSFSENVAGSLGQTKVNFEIIKPNGLGLVIDTGMVYGGGYLYLDYENERYLGWLTLEIGDLGLDAIAIYSKTPTGFSFLGLVTVSFPKPIPLAFGFYLQGVGGLIGLHRGISTDALRQGIRTGALDQVLFPENIISQFQSILDSLEGYFPIAQGRHSFGLLFDLSYGQSKMITLELGLFATFPSPIIIALAGKLKVRVPEDDGKKFLLNCAFVGIYDEARKLISFDASIYDSLLANSMAIEGDIAARFGWGENKIFLITVGGFHPLFSPDSTWNLPSIRRLNIRFRDTGELKVFTESYFAITSNTFQAGARFEVRYKKGKIEAIAFSGFDALFFFNPFRFSVSVYVGAEVTWRGRSVAGVNANIFITGPGRWNARGNASVEILRFDVRVNFDISWGNDPGDSLPAINVKNLLIEEIQKNSSWNTPEITDNAVTTKKVDDDNNELVVSPFSVLQVRQEIIPLDFTINKYGENPATSSEVYQLDNLRIVTSSGADLIQTIPVEDYFAPNQFKLLNESERLQAASFELLQSGIKGKEESFDFEIPLHFTQSTQQYHVVIANDSSSVTNSTTQVFNNLNHLQKVGGGALGKHKSYRMNKRKKVVSPMVRLNPVHYRAVYADTLLVNALIPAYRSKSLAIDKLERLSQINAGNTSNLKVVSRGTYGKFLNEVMAVLTNNDIDR